MKALKPLSVDLNEVEAPGWEHSRFSIFDVILLSIVAGIVMTAVAIVKGYEIISSVRGHIQRRELRVTYRA